MATRQDRIDRYQDRAIARAEKAGARSASAHRQANQLAEVMNGQPILIGHHSERRHRRDIDRMHNGLRRGIAEGKKAEHYQGVAAGAESTGISVHDDDARELLAEKLAGLEAKRDEKKRTNAAFRKAKGDPAKLAESLGWKLETAERVIAAVAASYDRAPHPAWELSNLGAQIRTAKARLKEVAEVAAIESGPIADGVAVGLAFAFEIDTEDERVWCTWESRPPREICREMRSGGFVFSRSRGAWVRRLTAAAIQSSRWLAERLARITR